MMIIVEPFQNKNVTPNKITEIILVCHYVINSPLKTFQPLFFRHHFDKDWIQHLSSLNQS